jgi:hypothetical protein
MRQPSGMPGRSGCQELTSSADVVEPASVRLRRVIEVAPGADFAPTSIAPGRLAQFQGTPETALALTPSSASTPSWPRYATLSSGGLTPSVPGHFNAPSFQRSGAAMDEYLRTQFIRGLAQECRMHAAMTKFPEGRQRWLDAAQEYERQADRLEAINTRRVGSPSRARGFLSGSSSACPTTGP